MPLHTGFMDHFDPLSSINHGLRRLSSDQRKLVIEECRRLNRGDAPKAEAEAAGAVEVGRSTIGNPIRLDARDSVLFLQQYEVVGWRGIELLIEDIPDLIEALDRFRA